MVRCYFFNKGKKYFILLINFVSFLCFRAQRTDVMKKGHSAHQIFAEEEKTLQVYKLSLATLSILCVLVSVINYSEELHFLPPQDFCTRSNVRTNLIDLFSSFILPSLLTFVITLCIGMSFQQVNPTLCNQIISVKTCILFIPLLATSIPSLLNSLNLIEISLHIEGLWTSSILLAFVILKGPLFVNWTFSFEEQQHDPEIEEIEMQSV